MKEKYFTVAKTIKRWKIDTPFENWLGSMADKSELWKRIYLLYYRIFDSKYYKGGIKFLYKEIEKQYPRLESSIGGGKLLCHSWLWRDMIYSQYRFGCGIDEYFIMKFYNHNAVGRSQFNTIRLQYGYCELVNSPSIRDFFEDKGKSYKALSKYYKRDVACVYSNEDFSEFEDFYNKHNRFIFKPNNSHSGWGIKICEPKDMTAENFFKSHLEKGTFVVEELIQQAEPMSRLHPESINTLRVLAFNTGKEVKVIETIIRIGTGIAFVDNAGSGGIFAHVDSETGIVDTYARDYINNCYTKHPDTNITFVGFQLPDWHEAINVVKEAQKEIEGATMISWDLAYCDRGWVVVEANDIGEQSFLQSTTQRGIKQKIVSLIDEYYQNKQN